MAGSRSEAFGRSRYHQKMAQDWDGHGPAWHDAGYGWATGPVSRPQLGRATGGLRTGGRLIWALQVLTRGLIARPA
jgi:hypothetical protein